MLSQPLAASLILIRSCSNIVAFEIVDGPALKEMIFAYVFYKAIFSKAFYFCLCLRASLPFPTPKLRHFPCFFFPPHIFLHYPHTLPNLSIHSPSFRPQVSANELHSASSIDFCPELHLLGKHLHGIDLWSVNTVCPNQTILWFHSP